MKDDLWGRLTPLLLIVFGAYLIAHASWHNWPDVKSFGISVGGAGLALLTQQATHAPRNGQDGQKNGGEVDTPPPPKPPATTD